MSQLTAQRCVHDPVPRSSLGRCPSRPGAIDPQNAHFRRLALEGVWWTAARTEGLLGESPHDPGAQCAGSSVSGRTHPSQHRGHLRGFGCVPGLSPGVAPDGDDARSRPPQPHRDDTSGSARGERRSRRRAAATPSPPRSEDKAISNALTYANGSIRWRLAPARMLKQIAAVSPPWSLPTNNQFLRLIAQSRNVRSAVLLSISR